MKFADLFYTILIQTKASTENSGDVDEFTDEGISVRAKVTQIDGTRYMTMEELKDREVYEIELWDNDWSNNICITFGTKVLYPIRPLTRNAGAGNRSVVKILAATKA
jgi:hypothetical protein